MEERAIKEKVNELVRQARLMAEAKKKVEEIKAELLLAGLDEMEDKKLKTVEFWGSTYGKVVVQNAETVKVISPTILRQMFGEVIKDFEKETVKIDYSEPFKRFLTTVFNGDYTAESLEEVIAQITTDKRTQTALKKKLKGNWAKDVAALECIALLNPKDAEYWAYMVADAINGDRIRQMVDFAAMGKELGFDKFIESIKAAYIIEESPKIKLESANEEDEESD